MTSTNPDTHQHEAAETAKPEAKKPVLQQQQQGDLKPDWLLRLEKERQYQATQQQTQL